VPKGKYSGDYQYKAYFCGVRRLTWGSEEGELHLGGISNWEKFRGA